MARSTERICSLRNRLAIQGTVAILIRQDVVQQTVCGSTTVTVVEMSWKTAGRLVSGPPTASGSGSGSAQQDRRFRPNTGGLNAFQREQQFAAHYGRHGHDTIHEMEGKTDWDVLKENHRFIRDDEEAGDVSWEERLARAYESKLFKEFALVS